MIASFIRGFALISVLSLNSVFAEIPSFMTGFQPQSFHALRTGEERIGKTKAGWSIKGDRIYFIEDSEIQMTLYKRQQNVTTRLLTTTDFALKIYDIEFSFKSDKNEMKIKGHRVGNDLKISVSQAGRSQEQSLPLAENVLVSSTIRPYLVMQGLPEKSKDFSASFLEPSAFTIVPIKMKVSKLPEKNRWKAVVEYLNQSMTSEIDESGNLIKEESDFAGMPVIAEAVNSKKFKDNKLTGTKEDLVERARVHFGIIDAPKSLKEFKVKIEGIDLSAFELTRHRQKLNKDQLSVKVEGLPEKGLNIDEIKKKPDLAVYLESDAQTPVNNPTIQNKAKEIVGAEKDAWTRALKIHDFVYKYLIKEPTISVPNALEVLKTKKGDCNEHAALYTALARAAGVPTRTVVGLVYSDRFYGEPGFYYHAWVEVNPGNGWIALDPTWNQIPADATHLAFVDGGLDKQLQITSLMGKVKLLPS